MSEDLVGRDVFEYVHDGSIKRSVWRKLGRVRAVTWSGDWFLLVENDDGCLRSYNASSVKTKRADAY